MTEPFVTCTWILILSLSHTVFYFLAKSYIDSLDEEDPYEAEPLNCGKTNQELSYSLLPNSEYNCAILRLQTHSIFLQHSDAFMRVTISWLVAQWRFFQFTLDSINHYVAHLPRSRANLIPSFSSNQSADAAHEIYGAPL